MKEGNKLLIDIARLDPGGETFEGEIDAIDLEEEFVHPSGGIRYSLNARLIGRELLVRGRLEQDFTLACSRCGRDFDTTISVEDFETCIETGERDQFADLTGEARDCIILELSAYPVCGGGCEIPAQSGVSSGDARWEALDALSAGGDR